MARGDPLATERCSQPVRRLERGLFTSHRRHSGTQSAIEPCLKAPLPRGRSYVCYSRPAALDKLGEMKEMKAALAAYGIPPERIHIEIFNGSEPMSPGRPGGGAQSPCARERRQHRTVGVIRAQRHRRALAGTGQSIRSILELAEACDVPVRWSCRTGLCHNCESGLVSGAAAYEPEPLDKPAEGNVLVCCSQPIDDLVIDL